EPDGVELLVVGAKRIGADQFGKRGGLVGRSRAQRAHLMEHDGNSACGDLPSCLGSGKPAADHVHCLRRLVSHGQKLFLSRRGDNAGAARRRRQAGRVWMAGFYAFFCRRAGWLVLTSACNGRPSDRRFRKVLITTLPRSVSVTMMNGMNVVQKMLRKIIFLPV